MLGAIVGDVVGSIYEFDNIKTKDFPFFQDDCFFTDDTVMTCAVAEAIMEGGERCYFIDAMKKFGKMYPNAGYGISFDEWINSNNREPYGSFGNGSAMRVSPCGELKTSEDVRKMAKLSAEVTHNHVEGIKGALAVADAIFICNNNDDVDEAKRLVKENSENVYGYDLRHTLDEIRPTYFFNETCQETVPQAIQAFLESTNFEDAIRNAISLGGDSDTLAAITGSIAEVAYGVPDWIEDKAIEFLDEPLKDALERWKRFVADITPSQESGSC